MIIAKKHRLDSKCYQGYIRANFTLCIKERKHVFIQRDIVKKFIDILGISIEKYCCINWVYLFMPDHLHFIIEGTEQNANLWKAVVLFKQRTGCWFSKNIPNIHWQNSFFDHIHRKDSELEKHIMYILYNPIRKGIVKEWQDYNHKGSLNFNLDELIR